MAKWVMLTAILFAAHCGIQSGQTAEARPTAEQGEDTYREQVVKKTVAAHSNEVEGCYNKYIRNKPIQAEGTVTLDWRILPSGKITRPGVVAAEIGDDAFQECILRRVALWKFPNPPSREAYYVEHNFSFNKTK